MTLFTHTLNNHAHTFYIHTHTLHTLYTYFEQSCTYFKQAPTYLAHIFHILSTSKHTIPTITNLQLQIFPLPVLNVSFESTQKLRIKSDLASLRSGLRMLLCCLIKNPGVLLIPLTGQVSPGSDSALRVAFLLCLISGNWNPQPSPETDLIPG